MIVLIIGFYKKWIIAFCTSNGPLATNHFEYLALKEGVIFAQNVNFVAFELRAIMQVSVNG
jgi:hypothetical protein